jgi:hypothetical protein
MLKVIKCFIFHRRHWCIEWYKFHTHERFCKRCNWYTTGPIAFR